MSDSEIIDFYYSAATAEIKESWFEFSQNECWYNYILNLPDKERVTYLVTVLDDQVYNGGFNQYFVNGYGQFATLTINALKLIQAEAMAELVKLGTEKVNAPKYDDFTFRQKLLRGEIEALYEDDSLDNYLETLDEKYTEYPQNIGKLLSNYLRKT